MSFLVRIKKVETGEIAFHAGRYCDDWGRREYIWTEGNYSCDCNREVFFKRAMGVEPVDVECGWGAFRIRVEAPDCSILYDEWE